MDPKYAQKSCMLVCLDVFHTISKSFVVSIGVPLSEVEYAERCAGQLEVIANICPTQVHRAALLYLHYYSPQLHSTLLARSLHLCRNQVGHRSLEIDCNDVIWSATRQNMQFVVDWMKIFLFTASFHDGALHSSPKHAQFSES